MATINGYAIATMTGSHNGAAQVASVVQSANSRHTVLWDFGNSDTATGNSVSLTPTGASTLTITYCPWSLERITAGSGWSYALSQLPRGLLGLTSTSSAAAGGVTGSVLDLPDNIDILWIANGSNITGNLDLIPGLTTNRLHNAPTTGDIVTFATNTQTLYGNATADWTCSAVPTFRAVNKNFTYSPTSGGLTAIEVDRVLEGLAAVVVWSAPATVIIDGTNAIPGTASTEVDGWIDQIEANGATVTVNS